MLPLGETPVSPRNVPRNVGRNTSWMDLVSDPKLVTQNIHSFVTMAEMYIESTPYKWPFNGNLTPQNTCIIVIVSESRLLYGKGRNGRYSFC